MLEGGPVDVQVIIYERVGPPARLQCIIELLFIPPSVGLVINVDVGHILSGLVPVEVQGQNINVNFLQSFVI